MPVTYVELSEAEERLVLASLDPLAAMATAEKDALAALLAEIETGDAALARMLTVCGWAPVGLDRLVAEAESRVRDLGSSRSCSCSLW